MNPAEVTAVAGEGVDIQIRTHRHQSYRMNEQEFMEEIQENRLRIVALTAHDPRHFCYPSGNYHLDYLPVLSKLGTKTATTCDPGLAAKHSDSLLLPRYVDTALQTDVEFAGWLSGISTFQPRRKKKLRSIH